MRAVAKGVRRTTSKFGARLEPLSHVALLCWQGRRARHREPGRGDRHLPGRARGPRPGGQGLHPARGGRPALPGAPRQPPALRHGGRGARAPSTPAAPPMLVPAFFLKVLALEGSAPVVDECVSCGEDDDGLVAFDLVEGGVLCRSCRRGRSVSPAGLELLRRILGGGLAAACWPSRGAARRRGHRPGHRGHGGPSRPAAAQRALEPGADVPVAWDGRVTGRPPGREDPPTAPFGVYVHVPFCRCALRLLRLRHLDRPRPPDGRLRRRLRGRDAAGPRPTRACPRRRPCSSAGAPRRGSRPSCWSRILDAVPRRRRRRGHRRVQPRGRRRRTASAGWREAGVTRVSFGVQSMVAPRAGRAWGGATARTAGRRAAEAVAGGPASRR